MLKKLLTTVLILSFFVTLSWGKSGLTASFKTGFPLSGSSFGLKLGPLNPYCGFDIARISGNYEYNSTNWSQAWFTEELFLESDYHSSIEGSALLLIPHLGLKMNLWKAFILGEAMLCLPSIDGKSKGKDIQYLSDGTVEYIDEWDEKLSKDDKKMIKDALDFIGLKLGFGAEYFLNEHVSIGGEFGIRLLLNSFDQKDTSEDVDNGIVYYREKWSEKLSASLGVTYTSFSLNFIL